MKSKIIILAVIIAVIAISVLIAASRQNQDTSAAGGNEEQSATIEFDAEGNPIRESYENRELVLDKEPDSEISADAKMSKQQSKALIHEMLQSLSDLEETVDSLDDVSDSDLQIPD